MSESQFINVDMGMFDTNNFKFSSAPMEHFESDSYTVVNIAVDASWSVEDFKAAIDKMLKTIRRVSSKHQNSENLIIRVITFDGMRGIVEVHGYTTPDTIDDAIYNVIPDGSTPLLDAIGNIVETSDNYIKTLNDLGYTVNSIFFVATDGEENSSRSYLSNGQCRKALKAFKQSESCESVLAFLIGINIDNPRMEQYLMELHEEVGFDWIDEEAKERFVQTGNPEPATARFVKLEDADDGTFEKLTGWILESISSQSSQVGSGAPSKPVNTDDFDL